MSGPADIWGDAVRTFLARYDNRKGRGGFPTTMDRAAIQRVLGQRDKLVEAAADIVGVAPLHMLDGSVDEDLVEFVVPVGALRALSAALTKAGAL